MSKQRYGKIFVQLSNFPKSVFALENPTHWDWETTVFPIFAKLVLDNFVVCSLVPWINLSHMQCRGFYAQKNQNYLLGKADLKFFLSYKLQDFK